MSAKPEFKLSVGVIIPFVSWSHKIDQNPDYADCHIPTRIIAEMIKCQKWLAETEEITNTKYVALSVDEYVTILDTTGYQDHDRKYTLNRQFNFGKKQIWVYRDYFRLVVYNSITTSAYALTHSFYIKNANVSQYE